MMIWMITANGSPQHIGNTDGMNPTKTMIENARSAGFCVKFACRAVNGNNADILMFDALGSYSQFRKRNPDITFADHASI